jgi:putative nucleotidyltransferase with HDIG domain
MIFYFFAQNLATPYNQRMAEQFVSVNLDQIMVGEPLPVTIYIYIDFRFITFRAEGDTVDRSAYDRLEFKRVKNLFVLEQDRKKFLEWAAKYNALRAEEAKAVPPLSAETKNFQKVREDVHRKTMDIFLSTHPDKIVEQTLGASKKLVTEVMKFPYAVKTIAQLQTYSKGTVDHSVNVSVLSVYLAMQMGYSHALILQHVGMGGLLHDLGKIKVPVEENDTEQEIGVKMREHPGLGLKVLESQPKVPNEVKMIVAQHHECHDGSGYPKKLRGSSIYDLARIVSIANTFDEIVGDGQGSLQDRQKHAIQQLDQVLYKRFDPQKLEKALKILKLGV